MNCWKYALLGLMVLSSLQAASQVIPFGNSAGQRKALREAIEAGDTKAVRRLLANGVNVNESFLSRIPLHDAVYRENEAIIKMLIEAGADVNRLDSTGRTALHMYIGFADEYTQNAKELAVVKLLLAHGARVDTMSREGNSPIDIAMSHNRPDIVKALLVKAPDMTLHQAAYIGRWERIEDLLDNGADVNEKDEKGRTALYHAACMGNRVDVVKRLIARGADVDLGDETFTPLYGAIYYSHYDVARVLIDNGANVNVQEHEGMAPLHVAINFPYTHNPKDIIEYLLAHGARVDLKDDQGNTPFDAALASSYKSDIVATLLSKVPEKTLHQAAHVGQWERIEFLLNSGTGVDERDRSGSTALYHAAWGSQYEVVERLIAKGADVNAATENGLTPLHVIAMRGNARIGALLLRHGASVDSRDKEGETALHKAASGYLQAGTWPYDSRRSEELEEVGKLLLTNGADVNSTTSDQQDTALHIAARCGNLVIAKLLLEHGANVNAEDIRGRTPLIQSTGRYLIENPAKGGQEADVEDIIIAMTELMLAEGADIHAQDQQGRTVLHYAAESGYPSIVRLLLSHGAHVDAKDNEGRTPLLTCRRQGVGLHTGSGMNVLDTVKLLISRGADVNTKDSVGHTALTLALRTNDPNLARMLVDTGADVNAVTDSGWMPLHLALHECNEKMALLLIDKGANIRAPMGRDVFESLHGSTPLHLAAQTDCIRVASRLIEQGANINAVNDPGRTPLHVAIEWSNEEISLLLIDRGADIQRPIEQTTSAWLKGATPLHLTARQGCIQVASKLMEKGVNVNAVNDDGATTAHLAIQYDRPELLELLLMNGANVHLQDKEGDTLLREAARRSRTNPDVIDSLISRGATITPTIQTLLDHGKTALQLAVEANDVQRIAALATEDSFREQIHLRCYGLPNSPTPLATAVSKGYTEVAKLLIRHGANVNETVSAGQCLLFHAARGNNTAVAQVLIDGGANVNQGDMFEETPLHQAAWLGHTEMVQLLLKNGANVNAVMRTRGQGSLYNACFTPLHNAALGGRSEVVKLLIANGSDKNAKDALDRTPMDIAAERNDLKTYRILEAAGARGRIRPKLIDRLSGHKMSPEILEDYVGQYQLRGAAGEETVITIMRKGESLFGQTQDQNTEEFYAVSDTEFLFAAHEIIAKVVFVKDSAGKVNQFTIEVEGESYTAFRIK